MTPLTSLLGSQKLMSLVLTNKTFLEGFRGSLLIIEGTGLEAQHPGYI